MLAGGMWTAITMWLDQQPERLVMDLDIPAVVLVAVLVLELAQGLRQRPRHVDRYRRATQSMLRMKARRDSTSHKWWMPHCAHLTKMYVGASSRTRTALTMVVCAGALLFTPSRSAWPPIAHGLGTSQTLIFAQAFPRYSYSPSAAVCACVYSLQGSHPQDVERTNTGLHFFQGHRMEVRAVNAAQCHCQT